MVAVVLALLAASAAHAPGAAAYVYWANSPSTIGRANPDGSGVDQTFIAAIPQTDGLGLDSTHIYWGAGDSGMGRANLNGSGINRHFIRRGIANTPSQIVVAGRYLYWADYYPQSVIGRTNLDGSAARRLFYSGGLTSGVAVHGKYIYWATYKGGDIGRAHLNGSGVNYKFITRVSVIGNLAVDGRYIYWADETGVGRANLDGSSATDGFIAGTTKDTLGVAVDSRHIYWTNTGSNPGSPGTIGRANLDGSAVNQDFITGAQSPDAVAVDGGRGWIRRWRSTRRASSSASHHSWPLRYPRAVEAQLRQVVTEAPRGFQDWSRGY